MNSSENEIINGILQRMKNENGEPFVSEAQNGAMEFKFDGDIPKTNLVFEEGDDCEDTDSPFSSERDFAVTDEPENGAEEVNGTHVAESAPVMRDVNDEEFIIPDTFVISEEFDTPLDSYVSTIWKTYVPRFTEVTENRNYFADNSAVREYEEKRRAEAATDAVPNTSQTDAAPSPVRVEQRSADENADVGDPIAETDEAAMPAVVVNVNGRSRDKRDTINVFKFPEEKRRREEAGVSEEELARQDITRLTGHKWEDNEENASANTDIPEENSVDAVSAYTTDAWSDTVADSDRLEDVYDSDNVPETEVDMPSGIVSEGKKTRANDTYEYNSFSMRDAFKDRFLDSIMAVKLRLIISVLLGAITLVFENLYLFGVNIFANSVVSYAAVDACLIAAMFFISLPETLRGIKHLFSGKVTPELNGLISAISLFAYTLAMTALPIEAVYPLFGFVYAVLSANSIYATYCLYSADFATFRLISEKGNKRILDTRLTRTLERENMALDGVIDEYKSKMAREFETTFVSDFFKTSSKRSENGKNSALVLALGFGVALVSGIAMHFIGDGIVSGFSAFALVISLALPAFSVLSHKLPFAYAEQEALNEDSAVVGERSFYEFSGVDVVAFDDTEVFGADDVSFKSISLSDKRGDFRDVMRKMSSLFSAVGGPLCELFAESLNKKYPAPSRVVIEDDGVEGIINGKRVMAGNVEYMQRHGIKIPLRNESSVGSTRIMYAAECGELFAKFTVNYAFSEEFALMLSSMRERGIVPLVYTRDFNINNEFMRFLTGGADVIRIMKKYNPVKPDEVYGKISAEMVTLGDKTSSVNMLILAGRYASFQSHIAVTELLACGVGAVLAVVIALCNMTAALPSVLLGVWQIAWSAALAIMSKSAFNKRNKGNEK